MKADILIRNGTIIDGTGKNRFIGNIAILDGYIIRISDGGIDMDAKEVIDAEGHVVAPGFIDTHVHSDLMLLADRQHASALCQGVTTEILGQDGLSYAPLSQEHLLMYSKMLAGLNGNPAIDLDWSSVKEFRMRFERTVAVNTAYQVPHGALRLETVGMKDMPLVGANMERAKALLKQGLQEGAVAFSTGLSYYPCSYSDTAEMIELCKVVAENNSVYVTHYRTVFREKPFNPIMEAIEISERSGAKLHFSHYRTTPATAGKVSEIMKDIDAAYRRGVDISLELYPYPSGSGTAIIWLPLWAFEGGYHDILARLADRNLRAKLVEDIEKNTIPCKGYFTHLPKNSHYIGRTFHEVAEERGQFVADMLCDLLLEEQLEVGYHDSSPSLFTDMDTWDQFNKDCLELLSRPYYMVGSDAILIGENPHPRGFGTFPRLLRFCREYNFPLETMINRMTKVPADRFGLNNRGVLAEGKFADIVIFKPDTVTDTATYALSRSMPLGINYVIVNGEVAVRDEKVTGVLNGRALSSG